ncbi:MAG: hypothetical protein CMJ18_07480, partial [Phycisphaeraceae bacterium]|nr:hypothetical protein [Phycisphaeraceae bacterium]
DDDVFRMWYRTSWDASCSDAAMAYATSTDGIHWERPGLGKVAFNDSTDNNLFMPPIFHDDWACHGARVLKDPPDRESDPARRYKMMIFAVRPGSGKPLREIDPAVDKARWGFFVAFSPDGLDWNLQPEPVILDYKNHYGGYNSVFYDSMLGRYVAYMQRRPELHFESPRYPVNRRFVSRMESEDFIHWTDPNYRVLGPDEADPPGSDLFEPEPFRYEPAGYAYINMALWLDQFRDQSGTRLAISRDNLMWRWAGERRPFIPHGPPGSWDSQMIHPPLLPALVRNDEILIYYCANGTSGMAEGKIAQVPRRRNVGLATLRLDGFISLNAGVAWGQVTTWPIVFKGSKLALNVDAERLVPSESYDHGVRVEITDPMNQVMPGYSYRDCDPIRVDDVRCPVTWKGNPDVSRFAGQPIKLRFYLSFASLYAFQFHA